MTILLQTFQDLFNTESCIDLWVAKCGDFGLSIKDILDDPEEDTYGD